jgi:hypothetical protein
MDEAGLKIAEKPDSPRAAVPQIALAAWVAQRTYIDDPGSRPLISATSEFR